jgi:hypothetical protein
MSLAQQFPGRKRFAGGHGSSAPYDGLAKLAGQ